MHVCRYATEQSGDTENLDFPPLWPVSSSAGLSGVGECCGINHSRPDGAESCGISTSPRKSKPFFIMKRRLKLQKNAAASGSRSRRTGEHKEAHGGQFWGLVCLLNMTEVGKACQQHRFRPLTFTFMSSPQPGS